MWKVATVAQFDVLSWYLPEETGKIMRSFSAAGLKAEI
jgi:hypothetical protein